MTTENLVTIITPFYNSIDNFDETYLSVTQQTHENWFWLIVDDGSNQYNLNKLKHLVEKDKRITLIQNNENLGAGGSRNVALKWLDSRSKYLTFLDADDFWDFDFLEFYLKVFSILDVDILYGGYRRIYNNLYDTYIPTRINNNSNILQGCDISCLSTIIKLKNKEFNYRFGEIPVRNDLVFYWSILKDYSCFPLPIAKATYRLSDNSISANKLKALKWQWIVNYRIVKIGLGKAIINCILWSFRGFLKYRSIR